MDKKPWPADAVVVVCPFPATAVRNDMHQIVPGHCRDCGRPVVVDGATLERANTMPQRLGRPVVLLCVQCLPKYDQQTVTHFEDHRRRNCRRTIGEG